MGPGYCGTFPGFVCLAALSGWNVRAHRVSPGEKTVPAKLGLVFENN